MRTRTLIVLSFVVTLSSVPIFARASIVWSSAATHPDEVRVYTPELANRWFNGTAAHPVVQLGTWDQPDFTATASTSARMWARWNGIYINVLDVILRASSGGDPIYGTGSTTARIVESPKGFYDFNVYATSTLQEYTLPVNKDAAIHHGDEIWAWMYPSWAAYGANHWVGSNGSLPYFEICEGSCESEPPPPPDPCAVPGACASNVLFLPGIEASRLYRGNDKLWEPNGDTSVSELAHDASGTSINSDIYVKKNDIIDNAYVPLKGNVYKSFIEQMNGLVTAGTIKEWEAVPYDWRLTPDQILASGALIAPGKISYLVATSSPYIIQELKHLAASSKTHKVTIIAHSNGGLVTKRLTELLGPEATMLIDKIVFVAVPQTGAPQAVGALLHGYDQGLPTNFIPYALSDSAARTLAKNMPMTYNLLPSAGYFAQVATPVVTFADQPLLAPFRARYGDAIQLSGGLHTFITDPWRLASSTTEGLNYPSVGNDALLTSAEALHTTNLDNWAPPSGIALYEIAGWGEKTLSQIQYYQGVSVHCTVISILSGCTRTAKIDYKPRIVLDGDGTVPTPSALWTPGAKRYWVNLQKYDDIVTIQRKHADILEVPQLRTFLQNVITNNENATLPEYISTSTPVNTKPGTELHFTLHSPLTLNLYDVQGRHTGISTTTGELEENIPESSYMRFGEVQFISVPTSLHTTLVMNGYADGSFTLDAEEVSGESVVASTTFAGIPSTASTAVTLDVPSGGLGNTGALIVDENGDGHTDITLQPKQGSIVTLDTTPPEARISFNTNTQKLLIEGIDETSPATILITATSSLITDEAGNTLQIVFKKLKQEGKELKVEMQEIRHNGISAGMLPKTVLEYEWSTDKTGKLKELEEKTTIGSQKIEGHYDAKKNVTKIEKKTLPGLVIIGLKTENGSLIISY